VTSFRQTATLQTKATSFRPRPPLQGGVRIFARKATVAWCAPLSAKDQRCVAERPAFQQRPALREVAPTFSSRTAVTCWIAYFFFKDRRCRLVPSKHPPCFAGTPTLVHHDVVASVRSTHPVSTGSSPCSPYGVLAFTVSTLRSFAESPTLLPYDVLAPF